MADAPTMLSEITDYQFGETVAPQGFDPNARGYEDAPIGVHVMEVTDAEIVTGKEFKADGQSYWLNQLKPRLAIAAGQPYAGATAMDFLPMPTPGIAMPAKLANRWANFLHSLGFSMPKDQVVPAGFKLKDIIGKRCKVRIVQQTDSDGTPKFKPDGTPRLGPKYFGYYGENEQVAAEKTTSGAAAKSASSQTAATADTKPASKQWDL